MTIIEKNSNFIILEYNGRQMRMAGQRSPKGFDVFMDQMWWSQKDHSDVMMSEEEKVAVIREIRSWNKTMTASEKFIIRFYDVQDNEYIDPENLPSVPEMIGIASRKANTIRTKDLPGYGSEKSSMKSTLFRQYIEKNKNTTEQKRFDIIFSLLFVGGLIGLVVVSPSIAFNKKYGLILMFFMIALMVSAMIWGVIRRKLILRKILDVPTEIDKRYLKESDFNELFCQTSIAIFLFPAEPDEELLKLLYIRLKNKGLLRSVKLTMYLSKAPMINQRYGLQIAENKWIVSIPFTEFYITEDSVRELAQVSFAILK